jgi:hypothetical protein
MQSAGQRMTQFKSRLPLVPIIFSFFGLKYSVDIFAFNRILRVNLKKKKEMSRSIRKEERQI